MAHSFKVNWTARLEGEFVFVREELTDRGPVEYGPMPRDFAGPFIDERREYFESICKKFVDEFESRYGQASDLLLTQTAINGRPNKS